MSPAPPEPAELKREIGLFGATAQGIGAIIGSGIFIVTGIVAGIAGPAMIISLLIAGIIALFSALHNLDLRAIMIAAILLADLGLVVSVSTFRMLVIYLIANITAFRIPSQYRQYPAIVPVIGAVSCIGLIGFLTINSWIIGIIGVVMGIAWFIVQRRITR
jgi:hypothetical protein